MYNIWLFIKMFSTIMHLKHVTFNIKYNIFKINELLNLLKFRDIKL